jgi:hypothetical protein
MKTPHAASSNLPAAPSSGPSTGDGLRDGSAIADPPLAHGNRESPADVSKDVVPNNRRINRLEGLALAILLAAGCGNDGGPPLSDASTDAAGDGSQACVGMEDTDGDTIPDTLEGDSDLDGDTVPNDRDEDSDGDTIGDRTEGGIDDVDGDGVWDSMDPGICQLPDNSDASATDSPDATPDFLDTDADNDGVTDADESSRYMTDPKEADTDGDGVTDLGEIAAGTDPNDSTSTVSPDDFFVILPYEDPEVVEELEFGTDIQLADVFFLTDTTGSMGEAIENVNSSLTSVIVPGIASAAPDIQMGAGEFRDFPVGGIMGYGSVGDLPFELLQTITDDIPAVQSAINSMMAGGGADTPESHVEALYQTATGVGFHPWVPAQTCLVHPDEDGSRVGYPCFRPDALPIIVLISDAPMHNGPDLAFAYNVAAHPELTGCADYNMTVTALLGIGARVIGVSVDSGSSSDTYTHMSRVAQDTGSVDETGSPLIRQAPGGSVSTEIVDMILTLAAETPMDIGAVPEDEPNDPGPGDEDFDATRFIIDITPKSFFPADGASGMDEDLFFDVTPGTSVTFDVTFKNDVVEPEESAQVFKAWIDVMGNGVARLDERMVIIIVPTESGIVIW